MFYSKQKAATNQITEGVIWKGLLLFFFPILFGSLFQQIYNTADTIVVGRFVGKEALAAVGGSASMLVSMIVGFFVGLSSGASVVIAQFYGARDQKNLQETLHTAIAFSAAAGVLITIAGILLSDHMLRWMNTPADIMKESGLYLRIYFCGMVCNLLYNMGAGILRAAGDSKRPLIVLILTCVLNILLDILFVVVFRMGVAGVAFATILSQAVSAVLVLGFLIKGDGFLRLDPREIRLRKKTLLRILRIGIPVGLESVMYSFSNVVVQVYINNLGTDYVAAWGTLSKIDCIFWMVQNAFGIAITTYVGQNFGAGKYDRMRKSVRTCLLMSFASAIVIVSGLFLAGGTIFRIFTTDQAVLSIGIHMMRFIISFYGLYVVIGILSGALRGAGYVLVPMLLSCGGVCCIRLLWLWLYVTHHPTVENIMLCYPISWGITAVLFVWYYLVRFPGRQEPKKC